MVTTEVWLENKLPGLLKILGSSHIAWRYYKSYINTSFQADLLQVLQVLVMQSHMASQVDVAYLMSHGYIHTCLPWPPFSLWGNVWLVAIPTFASYGTKMHYHENSFKMWVSGIWIVDPPQLYLIKYHELTKTEHSTLIYSSWRLKLAIRSTTPLPIQAPPVTYYPLCSVWRDLEGLSCLPTNLSQKNLLCNSQILSTASD